MKTKAWVLEKFGYEGLSFKEFDIGELAEGEILVKVLSCGVCYRDIIDIQGGFKYTILPTVPGHEICGIVEKVKAGNNDIPPFSEGDIVISRHGPFCGRCELCLSGKDNLCTRAGRFVQTMPGGYSEYVKAHWSAFVKVPENLIKSLSYSQLSIIFCAVGTAYRAIAHQGEVKSGDLVLITGASGGVGLHAIQIAKESGAYVLAVTSSKSKVEKLKEFGADDVILSEDMRFNDEVMKRTGGRGVDVVIENTGSVGLEGAIRSLKLGGILVLIGNIKVDRYQLNPGMVIVRELKLKGSVGINQNELQNLFRLIEMGKVRPIISEEFPLEKAVDSHLKMKSKNTLGRFALVCNE
jgi:D-arabinose 1-dehydrogenase-like Zn-dependent alcohol dehydrogenase